jgi:porphobilinogen deaminase
MLNKVVIGTRGSELALWQAHYVESIFKAKNIEVEIFYEGNRSCFITKNHRFSSTFAQRFRNN